MNALDKTKKTLEGLSHCKSYCDSLCPYYDESGCRDIIASDAFDVINALQKELKKRTSKALEKKPEFIILTNGALYTSDGTAITMVENCKVAIRIDDILSISDLVDVKGSDVRLNNAQQTTFHVCETIEEILGMIAKGEEANESGQGDSAQEREA